VVHLIIPGYIKLNQKNILTKYAGEMPDEIQFALKGISNPSRIGILIALLKHGKMTFNEMKTKFGLNPSSLSNHLTALQNGNLITNVVEKKKGKIFSFYNVTDIQELSSYHYH